MSKHIECYRKVWAKDCTQEWERKARFRIWELNHFIQRFASEDGFDEYCEWGRIGLQIGTDSADIDFNPRTWEAAYSFIQFCVCNIIVDYELDKYPYYKEMLAKYSKELNLDESEFGC